MKLPNAEHPITLSRLPERLLVRFKDVVVADSENTLVLQEANYPAVYYVPRADIVETHFLRTEHSSYCPYKGQASYFSLSAGADTATDAVWSYEQPYPSLAEIKEYVAFYPGKVSFEAVPR
jgi:uncharacterized protein (DUF427 family)